MGWKKVSDGLTSIDFLGGKGKGLCLGHRCSLPNAGNVLNATTFSF